MRSFIHTLSYIFNHPLNKGSSLSALLKFFRWQIGSRILGFSVIYPWIGGTHLCIKNGDKGLTLNIYCGLADYAEMSFILDYVDQNDVIYDIGANAGSYTILAAGVKKAKVVAFEPVPSTFERLKNNIAINHIESNVTSINTALGKDTGIVKFTSDDDCTNHVLQGDEDTSINTIEVAITTLNKIVESSPFPTGMKIDVEGYEHEVLSGALEVLKDSRLKFIIMETGDQDKKYNSERSSIISDLKAEGFEGCIYNPREKEIVKLYNSEKLPDNIIFARNIADINSKIKAQQHCNVG
jgi:FkbM family methyltransferase